jgi:hypothetical protein
MGETANRQSQQAHSIHGGMDRGSPQSTLRTVQPVQRSTHFNKRNPQSLNHQPNQHHSPVKTSDNEVSVVLSFRASRNAFAPSAPITFPTKAHTRVERSKYEFSKPVPMGETANRQSQQAHSIHGGMDRGSPQTTLRTVQPVQRSIHFNKRNPQSPTTNHQPNQHYSQYKFSDNEVSVVLSFRASRNAFAPSARITLPTKAHTRVERSK